MGRHCVTCGRSGGRGGPDGSGFFSNMLKRGAKAIGKVAKKYVAPKVISMAHGVVDKLGDKVGLSEDMRNMLKSGVSSAAEMAMNKATQLGKKYTHIEEEEADGGERTGGIIKGIGLRRGGKYSAHKRAHWHKLLHTAVKKIQGGQLQANKHHVARYIHGSGIFN